MPRVKDQYRKRTSHPKSRGGCITCKRRHVKCDETRPHCTQCTSRGRECAGYEFEQPGSQTLRIEISTNASVFESQSEHRAFSYFHQRTAEHLAGLLEDNFWNCTLLQIARSDPSIRHALIALASVHEDYEQMREADTRTKQFALTQYNRAIRCHVERSATSQHMTPSDVKSYLVACVVFICIEMLQGHPESAISLIKQAVALFYSLHATVSDASCSTWSTEIFEAILCRFQSMAVGLIGREAYSGTVPPRVKASNLSGMPCRFSSIRQAKEYLDFYLSTYELSRRPSSNGYIQDPTERDKQTLAAVAAYHDVIGRWSCAFDALKHQLDDEASLNERDRRTLIVLDIRRKFLTTLADFTRWDLHGQTFSEILDLIESIMHRLGTAAPFADSNQQRLFTLEVGTVSPLFMIARGCRDPVLRRRAIGLLRRIPVREGLWDSFVAAEIAERIMDLEEEAVGQAVVSAADIPVWARIPVAACSFDMASRRMVIKVSRRRNGLQPVEYLESEEFVTMY